MRLTLGSRTYDLTARALVLGTDGPAAALGADLVELAGDDLRPRPPPPALPVYALVTDDAGLGRALDGGAALVRLTRPTAGALGMCAAAGVAVVVAACRAADAADAGLAADHIVPDDLLLDVTAAPCPLAATVAGVLRGARLVRTDDVRAARRVCDVLAAIAEAGAG